MVSDVVIAGAGPNGLMLACELRLAGVCPIVLERLSEPARENRANGLVGQVVRMFERRGLYHRLAPDPRPPAPAPTFIFAAMPLDLTVLEDNPLYTLAVPQSQVEHTLAERAAELGVQIRRGHELTGLSQDSDGVWADIAGPDGNYRLRSRYLVGADGGHSRVRTLCGIEFPGVTLDHIVSRIAQVEIGEDLVDPGDGTLHLPGNPPIGPYLFQHTEEGPLTAHYHRNERGVFGHGQLPGRPAMVFTIEHSRAGIDGETPLTITEMHDSIRRVTGVSLSLGPPPGNGPHQLYRASGGNTRVADRYRDRRVLLVGDAAHVHSPIGGPGLNCGLQDAVNLGWKLAGAVHGWAPPDLLDSYHTERKPVGLRVAMTTTAQLALAAPGDEVTALRELFAELLTDRRTLAHIAEMMAGADIHYDMTDDTHPLSGRWAPDLLLDNGTGAVPLSEFTATARPLLLDFTETGALATEAAGWRDRVDIVSARCPSISATGLLLRPDCYIAWATDSSRPGEHDRDALRTALRTWFGDRQPPGTAEAPSPRIRADQIRTQHRETMHDRFPFPATADQPRLP